ncbi:hypothetical protein GWI33_009190 [Rhynchophorus ferrugineus]|uniref:Mos1 transposase HTH domain-containing protein n=1 Tax=Rhynchophorus ferrugineus TaxID=354439 RepID=A0A834MGP5_RHYFE|nr:hypothetical protein GWI33_009190 [Rhynchophorus ferrugineus]
MDKKEFRVMIKYCFLKGKNTVEAKTWLDAKYPDTALRKSTIKDWYAKFGRGEMITEDDPKLKSNEIADTLKILAERVHHIIHEYLDMGKLCAKWAPWSLLTKKKTTS